MKAKTKNREEERIWNLAYLLIFTIATNGPRVSVGYKEDLLLTEAAHGLQTCLAAQDPTQQRSALLHVVFSSQDGGSSPQLEHAVLRAESRSMGGQANP